MPIEIDATGTLGDLIHDQSEGLTDDDKNFENVDGVPGLEALSPTFYSLLVGTGLVTDNGDLTDTYAERVGVGDSGTDWITVSGEGEIQTLQFAADSSGGALDGDGWTDGGSNVVTADTGEQIYLYAVEGGSMVVGSTLDLATDFGGVAPTSLSDFGTGASNDDYSNLVIAAYLDAESDYTSAEVYYASFRPVVNPTASQSDGDYIDLADNVWLFGDSSQVLTFSGLAPKKFQFGIAGEDAANADDPAVKIFVLAENYKVKANEDPINGPSSQPLNTSSAGVFWQFPEIDDVATVGVQNQSVNPDQGIFVMLVATDTPTGNYFNGHQADDLLAEADESILKQTQMSFGIVQSVGNQGRIIEVSGYDSLYTSGVDLIQTDNTSLGDANMIKGIEAVGISWIDGDGGTIYTDEVTFDGDLTETLTLNGRTVTLTFSGDDGDGNPTKVKLSNVASQDLITVDWVEPVDHALLHTVSGAIDWGIVAGSFGNPFSANIGANMLYDDDGPVASVSVGTEPGLQLIYDGNYDQPIPGTVGNYEGNNDNAPPTADGISDMDNAADGPNSVTVDFAGAFTANHNYGTDGEKSTSTVYAWSGPTIGADVKMGGSTATSDGTDLVWATTTNGYAAVLDGTTTEVFTITRAGSSVTFTLKGPIDHPIAESDNVYTDDVLTLDGGQIGLTRTDTIVDNDDDDDNDNATVDLGGNFGVGDDAPIVNVTKADTDALVAALGVNLDETIDPDDNQAPNGQDHFASGESESDSDLVVDPDPVNGDLDDVVINGVANTPVYLEAPVGAVDADGTNTSAASQAIGKLESTIGQITALFSTGTASTSFGADGADTTLDDDGIDDTLAFDLSLNGVATNLIATPVVGSVIEDWSDAQRTVHLYTVDDSDGDITVIEGRLDGPGANDEYVILRMTLTNKDDPANATIVYENFAPVQHDDHALQDEGIKLLIPETAGDPPVQETLSIVYTVTARDKDLDTDTDSKSVVLINDARTILEIDDDGPGAQPGGAPVPLAEDALPNGRLDDAAQTTSANGSLVALVNGGTDGVKDFGFVTGAAATAFLATLNGAYTSGGQPVVWSLAYTQDYEVPNSDPPVTDKADVLTAKVGTTTIFEVAVFHDGTYGMILSGPFDHARALADQDDGDSFIIDFTDGLFAREGDGDPVDFQANALRAAIEDDAPLAGFNANSDEPGVQYLYDGNFDWVDGDGTTPSGNFEGNNDETPPTADGTPDSDETANGPNTVDVNFSGIFNPNHDYGADGEGSTTASYALSFDTGVSAGDPVVMSGVAATSGGVPLVWALVGSTYEAQAGGNTIFALSVNTVTGVVTFTQKGALDHPVPESSSVYTDDILTLDPDQILIVRTDSITDADQDPSSASTNADLGGNFGIGDDAPTASVTADGTEPGVQYLYDGNANSGNYAGNNDNPPPTPDGTPTVDNEANGPNTVTVSYAAAFNASHSAGADGEKSSVPVYTLALGAALDGTAVKMSDGTGSTSVTSGDTAVIWDEVDAQTIRAIKDGTSEVIFTISVNKDTGAVTFTQTGVLDHRREDTAAVYTSDIFTLDDNQISIVRTDTVTDNDDDDASDFASVDLGGNFGIGDDAPDITASPDVTELPFTLTDPMQTVTMDGAISYGGDGAGNYIISAATLPTLAPNSVLGVVSYSIASDGQSVTYSYDEDGSGSAFDPVPFYSIALSSTDPGDYTATVLSGPPLVEVNLLAGSTFPGGPIEEFTPTGDGSFVTFDGFISDDWNADTGGSLRFQFYDDGDRGELGEESAGFSNEDINIDSNGIGLENAIMNPTEALAMYFDTPQVGAKIVFDGATGGLKNFQINIEAYFDDGAGTVTPVDVTDNIIDVTAPKGPNQTTVKWISDGGVFNELYLSLSIEGNDAIRIPEISTFSFADIEDLSGTITLALEDFDGDKDTETINWSLDGSDDDGV